jgi:hypothetical protein
VAVALVVAEKEVLAVLRAIVAPILACYLDSGGFRVLIPCVCYTLLIEPSEYIIASIHCIKVSISITQRYKKLLKDIALSE